MSVGSKRKLIEERREKSRDKLGTERILVRNSRGRGKEFVLCGRGGSKTKKQTEKILNKRVGHGAQNMRV